ncbi:MAG: hypothetical protein HXL75_07780 [[Eubacterium] sulci]|nr:hypothetical protein [[Eubacterium] sulci]
MLNDDNVIGCLYIPIAMILLLGIMIFFHRKKSFKYVYMFNIFLYLIAIVTYFIIIAQPIGLGYESPIITVIKFIWLISIFGAYVLSISSIGVFIVEQAQRHMWAKVVLGLAGLAAVIGVIVAAGYAVSIIKVIGTF